jgi:hypothetical protein
LKNRIVIIFAILTAIFFFGTLSSCNSAMRQKARSDKEMAARIALEEKMSKFLQESSALEEKVKAKEKEAQEAKAELEVARKALIQEQMVNQGLKEELREAAKLKEASGTGKNPKK